ncbi:AAA family ATPase [Clavibacter capsici]|uniref:AAA family ATPase n=1 Tax=Clavibacter capsici TaxID=1874630 RepID=A0AAE6XQ30_9MICO|nr:AAA family ATPase [Clavibacter capsici]ALD12506.1 ATP-binding protein [Clavibacter capsici]QIS44649.1 AAA family ATPase [Clavibacter capsici]
MIRTLAVSGYRSVRDLVLPLTGLDVVTGANGSGKSNVHRALRLIADMAQGGAVGALAREGGLEAVLWAGPEGLSQAMRDGEHEVQGTMRKGPIALRLGFAGDELGYLVDLGIPQRDPSAMPPTMFGRDPEIKRELVFSGPVPRPRSLLLERRWQDVRVRDEADGWMHVPAPVPPHLSVLSEVADAVTSPDAMILRRRMSGWRFYDHLRTDVDAPARRPRVGTRTPVLASDGSDLAAAVQTIREWGDGDALDALVDRAFPGSTIVVRSQDGVLSLGLRQPGILRVLDAAELSDGTLRMLMLTAALLTTEPPELMVLNEPETSLHQDLLPALGELIAAASRNVQILVVTHAPGLAAAVSEHAEPGELVLEKPHGETVLHGQGLLSAPSWDWGRR